MSRTLRRAAVIAAATAAATTLAVLAPPGRPDGVPPDVETVTVTRVIDGDTIDATTDDGTTIRVRLLEVDTPERGRCWYAQATAYTTSALPTGSTAYLQADREPVDRYGRALRYVWNADGVWVNHELAALGHAEVQLYKPNDRHIAELRAAQSAAKKARLGMWSPACNPPTP